MEIKSVGGSLANLMILAILRHRRYVTVSAAKDKIRSVAAPQELVDSGISVTRAAKCPRDRKIGRIAGG